MKQLETTLFAVLQAIAMPICEAVLILSLMACDEKSPEAVVPSPKPETDESSSEGKEETPSFSGEDSICNDYQLTGLPVCYITTDSGAAVTSRTEYIPAVMRIVHNGKTLFEDSLLRIRGRGHASWTDSPKQPYRLKLSHKASFLGMAANKHFVLLSNYFDKSLMRAAIGFRVGQLFIKAVIS